MAEDPPSGPSRRRPTDHRRLQSAPAVTATFPARPQSALTLPRTGRFPQVSPSSGETIQSRHIAVPRMVSGTDRLSQPGYCPRASIKGEEHHAPQRHAGAPRQLSLSVPPCEPFSSQRALRLLVPVSPSDQRRVGPPPQRPLAIRTMPLPAPLRLPGVLLPSADELRNADRTAPPRRT